VLGNEIFLNEKFYCKLHPRNSLYVSEL
jgi:hypothetical protein